MSRHPILLSRLPAGADALIIISEKNQRALSGFSSPGGCLVVTRSHICLFADSQCIEAAKRETCPEYEVLLFEEGNRTALITERLKNDGARILAFEDDFLTVRKLEEMKKEFPDFGFVPVGTALEEMNAFGDEEENAGKTADGSSRLPPVTLLNSVPAKVSEDIGEELRSTGAKLTEMLRTFRIRTHIVSISRGPAVTRYELAAENDFPYRRLVKLVDDLSLCLGTDSVRIDAPISGKNTIGIEIPNENASVVFLRELIDTDKFRSAPGLLTACLGKDVTGEPVFMDIARLPHLLIAGATGSGKSVCMNSILVSLLYRASPEDVRLILIDPKMVEMSIYSGLPHLLVPVISDPKKAAGALRWAITEMDRRYELIGNIGVRNLKSYNDAAADQPEMEHLPHIVIFIDELADLMLTVADDAETSICRLAQKARAVGIHLIIGTQRPTVNVITGVIKANIPSRISFAVSHQIDSRVILDRPGAERLLGRGDMLYAPIGTPKPVRVQGTYVSGEEIGEIVSFIKNQKEPAYSDWIVKSIEMEAARFEIKPEEKSDEELLRSAIGLAFESGTVSISMLQRRLSIGFGRASKLVGRMEQMGIVSGFNGKKPRSVLITKEQYMEMFPAHDGDPN